MNGTTTDHLPLYERGTEGDFAVPKIATTVKSPYPLFQRGVSLRFMLTDY
jgi:hypothetical protein